MELLKNENGITIKQLKELVKDLPEQDEDGQDYTVWISNYDDQLTNSAKYIYPLNGGDILLNPTQ